MSVDVVENEVDYSGCYGHRGKHDELDIFLKDFIASSLLDETDSPEERWVACVWGQPGIGKTTKVKALRTTPVLWNGKEYPGWDVRDVPVAQFEEMGDIHGLPDKCLCVKKGTAEHWVSCELDILNGWKNDGWEVDYEKGTRTMYSPPDFVPTTPGPAVIIFDDANRTSQRILKGLMQVFQTHGTVSWKLPPGCVIVLTGNPGMQDFMVTELDEAIVQRMIHFTLVHDAKQWVEWAAAKDLDARGINYVARYPEMIVGPCLTSPRSLAKFFRFLKTVPSLNKPEDFRRVKIFAKGILDEVTVSSMLTFMQRDVGLVIEPEEILAGADDVGSRMKVLHDGVPNKKTGEIDRRIDILSVTVDRLFAHMVRPGFEPDSTSVQHFQAFATSKHLEDDLRQNLCMRLFRRGGMQEWILENDELTALVMEVI